MSRTPRSRPVEELLRAYNQTAMGQMARVHEMNTGDKKKDALVPQVAKALSSPEVIAEAVVGLGQVERAVLDRLILLGGETATSVIQDELAAEGLIDPPVKVGWSSQGENNRGSPFVRESRRLADAVARLSALGLVFSSNVGTTPKILQIGTMGHNLFIPDTILTLLPPVTIPTETVGAVSTQYGAQPDAFLRDLYLLLTFARNGPIPLTVKGQIPKRTLVQIDDSLRVPEGAASVKSEAELGRLPLLRVVAEDLGLLLPGMGGLQLGDAAMPFLSLPTGDRLHKVFEIYGRTERWSELARLKGVTITPRDGVYSRGIVAARGRILQEIAALPSGEWIPVAHLVDRMRKGAFEFLLPRDWAASSENYYGYSPGVYGGANHLQLTFASADRGNVTWDTIEGEMIRLVVREPLFWMGLVDLGEEPGEGELAFRITEVGQALLHGKTPLSSVRNPNIVVQPNFQIFAFDPTGEDVLFALDRIAERVRAEQVVEYRLTRESVYAAQRGGMEMAEILQFLDEVSSVPIPQNVRRTLGEWGAQLDRIVIRRHVSLLQSIDEGTLDALYADGELGRLLGRRIAPTAAIVSPEHLRTIYERLPAWKGTGGRILPALSEGDDGLDFPAAAVHADGRITFRQRMPSVYLSAVLRSFADEEDDGSFRLTPRSLQRAASARNGKGESASADQILGRLARVSAGPLPEEVTVMVRRWARDWGRGELAEVALLRVETEETMIDLRADDEIGPYVQPIPGAPLLAIVPREHAQRIREILLERGMELKDGLIGSAKRGPRVR